MVLTTRMPSFMRSPRISSTPQRLFSLAICWIGAMVSQATLGCPSRLRDLALQNSRKPCRCQRRSVSGLMIRRTSSQARTDPLGEEDEPKAIGWGEAWPVNEAVEDGEFLGENGVLRNQFSIVASRTEGRAEKDSVARRLGELEGSVFQRHQRTAYASDEPADKGR